MKKRTFIAPMILAASMGLASIAGCSGPEDENIQGGNNNQQQGGGGQGGQQGGGQSATNQELEKRYRAYVEDTCSAHMHPSDVSVLTCIYQHYNAMGTFKKKTLDSTVKMKASYNERFPNKVVSVNVSDSKDVSVDNMVTLGGMLPYETQGNTWTLDCKVITTDLIGK
jgi:hypothetical protein